MGEAPDAGEPDDPTVHHPSDLRFHRRLLVGGADYGCIVTCGATDRAIYESRLAASCRRDSQAPGGEPARRYFVQRLASSLPAPAGEIRHGDVAVKVKLRLVE